MGRINWQGVAWRGAVRCNEWYHQSREMGGEYPILCLSDNRSSAQRCGGPGVAWRGASSKPRALAVWSSVIGPGSRIAGIRAVVAADCRGLLLVGDNAGSVGARGEAVKQVERERERESDLSNCVRRADGSCRCVREQRANAAQHAISRPLPPPLPSPPINLRCPVMTLFGLHFQK